MSGLQISNTVTIPEEEIELHAIRSQGAGGQKVNKSATAIHLRFDINASSLPDFYKERLLALSDHRITQDGMVVLKSQEHRTQEQNREAALARLAALIRSVAVTRKARKKTRPTLASKKRRLEGKRKRGERKALRKKVL